MGKLFTITEGLENMGALKTGGQGSVYKTRRTGEMITAVKLLPTPIHSESADDKNFAAFQNEVQKLQKVAEHPNPNVVKILSSGITETGNLPFIEMEFIEGPDLEELLKPPRPPLFTIKEIIKVAEQLSNALAHCHTLGIRHGDIKSNNVKCNIHTGNYVLLDFGLAAMSDEQRRTSLRHAGAVEFMAPEQSEGKLLFETDIYSFGILLYELLAGTVPFPLKDGSEMARNRVMVAHLETPPPDVVAKRSQNLPASWTPERKAVESAVPQWLLNTVMKCLEKKPENRFKTGAALHDYIMANSAMTIVTEAKPDALVQQLRRESEILQRERESLQKRLAQFEKAAAANAQEVTALKTTIGNRDVELATLRRTTAYPGSSNSTARRASKIPLALLLALACLGVFAAYSFFSKRHQSGTATTPVLTQPQPDTQQTEPPKEEVQNRNIGQFKVQADKAYFHDAPDEATRRNAYLMSSDNAVVQGWDVRNNFIYTEYTNSRGQVSKGWLRRDDLITLEDWEKNHSTDTAALAAQLAQARILVSKNNNDAAADVYQELIKSNVPEAMYELSNLALHDKYEALPCDEALRLLKESSDKGYTPAKRTLGFLYLFAENTQVLQVSNYDRCPFEKNVPRGIKLLTEAVFAGDTTANKWLELHKQQNGEQ